MAETCEDCSCGLSDDDIEVQEDEIPLQMQFGVEVRDYVLSHLDVEDSEDTFIERVTVCPKTVKVEYREE